MGCVSPGASPLLRFQSTVRFRALISDVRPEPVRPKYSGELPAKRLAVTDA